VEWKSLNDNLVNPIVEKHFKISLSYNHILDLDETYNIQSFNKWEKIIIKQFQSEEFESGRYLDKFISEFGHIFYQGKELELAKATLDLKNQGILKPVTPHFQKD